MYIYIPVSVIVATCGFIMFFTIKIRVCAHCLLSITVAQPHSQAHSHEININFQLVSFHI